MQKLSYPVALAYCAENEEIADAIVNELSSICDFNRFSVVRDQPENLTSQLQTFAGPIILLISDNFLRSTKCMEKGLLLLSEHEDKILPVVIPGFRLQEDGSKEEVITSFERVSDIIQYINFWQDRYLDLRRQKREDPALDNEGFAEHLRRVRAISGEVGEHIRLLRSLAHLDMETFQDDHYEAFFEFLGEEEISEAFSSQFAPISEEETPPSPGKEPQEEPPVDLASIPGMSMLSPEVDEPTEEPPLTETQETTSSSPSLTLDEDVQESLEEVAQEEAIEVDQSEEKVEKNEAKLIQLLLEQAWDLADQEKGDEGIALLAGGAEQYSHNSYLRYNYALLLAQENHTTAASQEIASVLTLAPQMEDALFLAGELADINQDGTSAKRYFSQVLELRPEYGEAWLQLGLLSLAYEPIDKAAAIDYFKKAVKHSDDSEATYQLGRLYQADNTDSAKAEKYFLKTIEREPTHPMAHYELALLQHTAGDHLGALASYEQAVVVNPNLKTAENDAAFKVLAQKQQVQTDQATIEALQEQITQLQLQIDEGTTKESSPAQEVNNRCIFITGATSGIGRATAEHFARQGYRLIITGRRKKRLNELKKEWTDLYGVKIKTLAFDVRKPKAVAKAIENLPKIWSDIDILVNNAGKAKGYDPIHEGQIEHWDEMIDTNLKGLLYLTRAISPGMVARGSGHIINVASSAGKEVYPNGNVYCATKFAVDALTRAMRLDLHHHSVRVSQVAPAHVEETEFAVVRFDGDTERAKIYEDFQPLTSRDVAASIYFIAQQPPHVNILDVVLQGTQQASNTIIDRSGRGKYSVKEEE